MDRRRAVEIVDRFHAAQSAFYVGGYADALRALLTEDVAWHVSGRNAIAGDYRGTDAVLAYFTRRGELAGRTFRMHPRDVLVGDGDDVAVVTDGTVVRGGVERRWSTIGLYWIREERMVACWLLPLDAVDTIWAAPWVHVRSVSPLPGRFWLRRDPRSDRGASRTPPDRRRRWRARRSAAGR